MVCVYSTGCKHKEFPFMPVCCKARCSRSWASIAWVIWGHTFLMALRSQHASPVESEATPSCRLTKHFVIPFYRWFALSPCCRCSPATYIFFFLSFFPKWRSKNQSTHGRGESEALRGDVQPYMDTIDQHYSCAKWLRRNRRKQRSFEGIDWQPLFLAALAFSSNLLWSWS